MNKKIYKIIAILLSIITLIGGFLLVKTYYAPKKMELKQNTQVEELKYYVNSDIFKTGINNYKNNYLANIVSLNTIKLTSEMSGKIIYLNDKFKIGEEINKNEKILEFDCRNLDISILQMEEEIKRSKENLYLEKIKEKSAKKELKISNIKVNKEEKNLITNSSNIKIAESNLKTLELSLDSLYLDKEKCVITSPVTGIVSVKNINNLDIVASNVELGDIITSQKEIQIPISLFDLDYIDKDTYFYYNNKKYFIDRKDSVITNYTNLNLYSIIDNEYFSNKKVKIELIGKSFNNSILVPWEYLQKDNNLYIIENDKIKILKLDESNILTKINDGIIIKSDKNLEIIKTKIESVIEGKTIIRNEKNKD